MKATTIDFVGRTRQWGIIATVLLLVSLGAQPSLLVIWALLTAMGLAGVAGLQTRRAQPLNPIHITVLLKFKFTVVNVPINIES